MRAWSWTPGTVLVIGVRFGGLGEMTERSIAAGAYVCVIGYFAKISSARLNALSIAASGAIPFFNTSNSATLNTCSASTSVLPGSPANMTRCFIQDVN